jgi:O-antigen/teichoic acid export membrane protein
VFSTKSPVLLFQTIVSSVFGYVALFFINRYVGPIYWGYLSYIIAFGGLFTIITDLGFNTAHVKFISSEDDKSEDMGTYIFIKIMLNVVYTVVVIGSLLIWSYGLKRGFENPIEFWGIIAMIPYFIITNMIPTVNTFYRATLQSKKIAIPRLLESILRNGMLIFIGVIYFLGLEGNIGVYIILIFAAIYGFSYAIYLIILVLVGKPWKIGRWSLSGIKKYAKFALPLAFSTSLSILNMNLDKIIVQFFWGAIATGALYTDQKLTMVITSLTGSVGIFLLPLLSANLLKKKEENDKQVMEYERILSLIAAPFVIVIFFLSPFILNLYNHVYLQYSVSLSIIVIGTYIAAIVGPFQSFIISRGKQAIIAKISLIAIFINLILNILLIPGQLFGIKLPGLSVEGATIGFTISELFVYLAYKEIFRKLNKTRTRSTLIRHIIVATPSIILFAFVTVYVKPYSITLLLPIILAGLLFYMGMSLLLKEITSKQIIEILRNFVPRRS